ncbi:MAG: DUF177 domain-containing protein [Alphaproteobacteria bacterium]|nr:DUF177 domain-containing protein [Alphaproteobacteria bacterium]
MSGLALTLRADRIGHEPKHLELVSGAEERAALIERFDLIDLPALAASLVVRKRTDTGWITVTGSVRATVVQTCIVTLEPVEAVLETELEELFDAAAEPDMVEIDIDPLADVPEPLVDGRLDLGELVAQAFGLALDPYPRASGAAWPETVSDPTDAPVDRTIEASPFGKLAGFAPGAKNR